MKTRIKLTLSLLLVATLVSFAATGGWDLLGTKRVSKGLDHDTMTVGVYKGEYRSLKIVVTEGGVNMHKMVVVYGDRTRDDIPLKNNFKKGSDSRVVDLKGRGKIIKQIEFWYDAKAFSGTPKVTVFGKH